MRTPSVITTLLVWFVAALAAAPARADVPPPATYVEACTLAKQLTTTSECLTCGAYYGDMDRCTKMLSPYCYTKVCRAYGASVWTEVLCRTKSVDAPVVPSDIISILTAASTPGPVSSADGGVPKSCAPYTPPATGTATGTQSATETKSGTATQSATDSKTSTNTQPATDSKTSTDTQPATDSKTSTNTQPATDSETVTTTQPASDTQTGISTQPGTSSQSGTGTQSTTHSQTATSPTSTGTQTGSGPSGPTPSKTVDDSSGCSVTTGKSAVRALGPLTVILAGLALLVLRRRSRR